MKQFIADRGEAHGYTCDFDEEKHEYLITYPNGKQFPSYGVTTIQKVGASVSFDKDGKALSKTDILTAWSVKMCREAVISWFKSGEPFTVKILEDLFKSHTKKSDYSKNFGHNVHRMVETGVFDGTPEEIKCAQNILDNDKKTGTIALARELVVFMPSNPEDAPEKWRDFVCGKFDLIARRGEDLEMQDIKTSTGVYDLGYYEQLAGYEDMVNWMRTDKNSPMYNLIKDEPFKNRRVLLAKKDGTFTDRYVSNNIYDKELWRGVLHRFNIYKWRKEL